MNKKLMLFFLLTIICGCANKQIIKYGGASNNVSINSIKKQLNLYKNSYGELDNIGNFLNEGDFELLGDLNIYGKIYGESSTNIKSYHSDEKVDIVVNGAVTVNWNDANIHYIRLVSGLNSITLINPSAGGRYLIHLIQPSSGVAGTIELSPTPLVESNIMPTYSSTNNYHDIAMLNYVGVESKYILSVKKDLR